MCWWVFIWKLKGNCLQISKTLCAIFFCLFALQIWAALAFLQFQALPSLSRENAQPCEGSLFCNVAWELFTCSNLGQSLGSLFFFSLSFLTFLLFSFPCYFPLSLPLPLLLFIYFFAYFQRGINSVSYLHCFLKRKKCLKKLFFITDNFFPRWFDYPCLISTVN